MAFWDNWKLFGVGRKILKTGFIPYRMLSPSPSFNDLHKDAEKLRIIFSNPAVLKVFKLQCDIFSLAKVYVYDKAGREVKNHPALDRMQYPNPMQGGSQFLWDYMFWKMVGNAYLYMDSNVVERSNAPMYWLCPDKIEWPQELDRWKDKLILSESRLKELMRIEIMYRYEDGTAFKFPLSKLLSIQDISNGHGNWWKGYSCLDALWKIVANAEVALDSNNINIHYAGKFMVAGTQDPKDVSKLPMSEQEKKDIEERTNSYEQQVHAVKSMIDIKRFVSDLKSLDLDNTFLAQYYLIGSMYGIPRDVLEAYKSSTFENQEKARASHVSYTLEPAGEQFASEMSRRWELTKGWRIVLSWDHLPFTQVFEKERSVVQQQKAQTFIALYKAGVPIEEINIFLDTNFSVNEAQRQANARAGSQAAGGNN